MPKALVLAPWARRFGKDWEEELQRMSSTKQALTGTPIPEKTMAEMTYGLGQAQLEEQRRHIQDLRNAWIQKKNLEGEEESGSGLGSSIGSIVGTVGGALLGTALFPGLGTAVGTALGASLGGSVGGSAGGIAGGLIQPGSKGGSGGTALPKTSLTGIKQPWTEQEQAKAKVSDLSKPIDVFPTREAISSEPTYRYVGQPESTTEQARVEPSKTLKATIPMTNAGVEYPDWMDSIFKTMGLF